MKYAKLPQLGINENILLNHIFKSKRFENCKFVKIDITDRLHIEEVFRKEKFDFVANLAVQAGVQYSLNNAYTYVENNISGFINFIDASKAYGIKHFIYASSSSIYGNRDKTPLNEIDNVDSPISLYTAQKKQMNLWHMLILT